MDETWLRLLWILGCGGYGTALGGAFGAVTGAVYWGKGGAAGTALGHRIATAFENGRDREFSPTVRGAIVGGVDGFLFLGLVGTVVGALFAYVGRPDGVVVFGLAVAGVLLPLKTVCFGLFAYAIVRTGVWAVLGLFLGGVAGAFLAVLLVGREHLLLGVIPGMVVGTALSFLLRRYEPRFREVRAARAAHDKWREASDRVKNEAPEGGSDSIQKAAPSEE